MTKLKATGLGLAFALAAAASAQAAPAKTAAQLRADAQKTLLNEPGFVLPGNRAELDRIAERQDWAALAQKFEKPANFDEVMKLANWALYRIRSGDGYSMSYLYISTLGVMASSLEKAASKGGPSAPQLLAKAREMREEALLYLLYGLAVIKVDGQRCTDPTAPANKADEFRTVASPEVLSPEKLPLEKRRQILNVAIGWEKRTAPFRRTEDVMCYGGRAELDLMAKQEPTQVRPAPNAPGTRGRTYEVVIDSAGYKFFKDKALQAKDEAAARAKLMGDMAPLVGLAAR